MQIDFSTLCRYIRQKFTLYFLKVYRCLKVIYFADYHNYRQVLQFSHCKSFNFSRRPQRTSTNRRQTIHHKGYKFYINPVIFTYKLYMNYQYPILFFLMTTPTLPLRQVICDNKFHRSLSRLCSIGN